MFVDVSDAVTASQAMQTAFFASLRMSGVALLNGLLIDVGVVMVGMVGLVVVMYGIDNIKGVFDSMRGESEEEKMVHGGGSVAAASNKRRYSPDTFVSGGTTYTDKDGRWVAAGGSTRSGVVSGSVEDEWENSISHRGVRLSGSVTGLSVAPQSGQMELLEGDDDDD